MGLSGQSGAPRAGLAGGPLGPSLPFPPLSHLTQRPPSHLPGHRAMLQNLVCFSGPSQGLPPNWGGLQVRVRSRKPRPQVLEHRLQGDHSSQAPCTTEGTKHSATPVCPSPQPGHPPLMPRPLTRTPRPLLLLFPRPPRRTAHLDTQRSCCTAAAPAGARCTACCRRTTHRSACESASPHRRCWSTRSTGTTPRPRGHLWAQTYSITGLLLPLHPSYGQTVRRPQQSP